MRTLVFAIVWLIGSASWATTHQAASPEPQQSATSFPTFVLPDWFKISFLDLSEDNADAYAENRHLVVMFTQEFCPYCKALIEKNLTQSSIRAQFDQHFDVVSLDIWGDREVFGLDGDRTTEKDIARALDVQFTPTLMFFDASGQSVLRLNGYVAPDDMRVALDYVSSQAYLSQTIFDYLSAQKPSQSAKTLNQQDFISNERDLRGKMSAILFEQTECPDCDTFHRCVLSLPQVKERFAPFHTVQLDIWSDQQVITPQGETLSAREYAKTLQVAYAPTLILLDAEGEEVIRAESQLRNFHTEALLEFVSDRVYEREPNFQRYIEERGDRIRAAGSAVRILGSRDVCPEL